MSEKVCITNCHVHAFTLDHVPNDYLPFGLMRLLKRGWFRKPLLAVLRNGLPFLHRDQIERAARYAAITSNHNGQEGVLSAVRGYYPKGTRFVVLPMDMAFMGAGEPDVDLPEQHDDLAAIAREPRFEGSILPFATFHPKRPDAFDELRRCVEEHGFHGVKLYPPLGFPPDHRRLMDDIYPYCIEHNLPVISHCSRGGVRHKTMAVDRTQSFASPHAFKPVLRQFPELRVCLAHFGGALDWQDYLEKGMDPDDPKARERNWLTTILDMMKEPEFANLYTDISYTIFYFDRYFPALRVFLDDPHVRERVLFGSDFYMAEMEMFPERSLSIQLRYALGEGLYRQIAETNPERWLTGGAAGLRAVDGAAVIG